AVGVRPVAELGCEHHLSSPALDRPPDELLVVAPTVHVGGVEEVGAEVECPVDDPDRHRVVALAVDAGHGHTTEADRGDGQRAAPQSPVVHEPTSRGDSTTRTRRGGALQFRCEPRRPRPRLRAAVRTSPERGLRAGALTNNWVAEGRRPTDGLRAHFDVFVESAVVGLRKPDPRIYELVCRELRVPPSRAAFLDD